MAWSNRSKEYEKLLEIGRPPNIAALFPNSKALIVSGQFIDRALMAKGQAMTIAANARSHLIIRGVLAAAQKAKAGCIIEIAKSEGGHDFYCAVNYWNMARQVDALLNEMGLTIPVAIHADHYALKNSKDLEVAKVEVPSMFEAGITSIAIDASHQPDDQNLLSSVAINPYIPKWAGLECEVGEIKGDVGLSTAEDALFLIQGLNAHDIHPDWIALNNGTTHGIQASSAGIQVELTSGIHQALKPYGVSGAQHGTSGNSTERLKRIAKETRTTKANVATALQMVLWGVKIDDYGNAILDQNGSFTKIKGQGLSEELWAEMEEYGAAKKFKAGDFKSLNLPFENKILAQPKAIRDRMVEGVEAFVYHLLTEVFSANDTAPLAYEAILQAGSYAPAQKARRLEDPAEWTEAKILEKAKSLTTDKGPRGNYDD
ncbi:MAG: class II fructose-bisphosphate aldolase [Deltaproteobacteria bacterium]|jgi:fructose-bisphosphate aldolase class II|nr:class II fructose-bisphosphate aldolase [Deltaproteobacteria bacterium]